MTMSRSIDLSILSLRIFSSLLVVDSRLILRRFPASFVVTVYINQFLFSV